MKRPEVISHITAMQQASRERRKTGTLGLVPTMGALHEGHLSLVRSARKACDTVVVSIFVNPTQFGPNEDFARYPRNLEADLTLLEAEDVDIVFAPSAAEMYPTRSSGTFVEVPAISDRLDGAYRPGHFRGVATVVAKLFNIVGPDLAFFGQKDAAQVAVLRAMVRDLNLPLEIVVCPTVREPDGLAMSSRNRYLTPSERVQSLALHGALSVAREQTQRGICSGQKLRETMLAELQKVPEACIEYVEIVDPETLEPVEDVCACALLAVAARVGTTRLIDNLIVRPDVGRSCE
ncbi:MAG TPA: pantoate--beta-alanine ligase [Acidobacteriaceae bacterium]|jgi:pantoate--beta-alanine ligase